MKRGFRHTNSTLIDHLGMPLKVRQQRLGHSDPALTLGVYTHVASEDDERAAEHLGDILRPNAPKKEKPESAVVANSGYIMARSDLPGLKSTKIWFKLSCV